MLESKTDSWSLRISISDRGLPCNINKPSIIKVRLVGNLGFTGDALAVFRHIAACCDSFSGLASFLGSCASRVLAQRRHVDCSGSACWRESVSLTGMLTRWPCWAVLVSWAQDSRFFLKACKFKLWKTFLACWPCRSLPPPTSQSVSSLRGGNFPKRGVGTTAQATWCRACRDHAELSGSTSPGRQVSTVAAS